MHLNTQTHTTPLQLLYGALAMAPFLDVIWTTALQPGDDNPYGAGMRCPYVEMLAAIAALSAGALKDGVERLIYCSTLTSPSVRPY